MIEHMHTSQRMSKIVKHNGTVYLCGQVGGTEGTIVDQTRECLHRVETLLQEAGSSKTQILQAIIWLADISEKTEMDKVWDIWIPQGFTPARACSEAKLGRPELKVEIVVTASFMVKPINNI